MRNTWLVSLLTICCVLMNGCPSPNEPTVTPPQPAFISTSYPPAPIDHGLYADPGLDFIVVEWASDPSKTTTGYVVFRATNDTLGADGLLRDRTQVAMIESPNQLFETLDTTFIDSLGTNNYSVLNYYQVQAYHTSGSNVKSYSSPSVVESFALLPKPTINSPSGENADVTTFSWNDVGLGGQFQVIVRKADSKAVVWASNNLLLAGTLSTNYNSDGLATEPLVSGQQYQWRVKKIGTNRGSSSNWQNFSVK